MSVEQRLIDALRTSDRVEPSGDLWTRVVHSIEEDRAHRRRVVVSAAVTVAVGAALVAVAALGMTDGPEGRHIRVSVLHGLQFVALAVLVAVLGPAIRRFGRGYAGDLWRTTPATATNIVRLLDVAYVLVFAGYILLTGRLDLTSNPRFGDCGRSAVECVEYLPDQLWYSAVRIGGLLLVMGVLHAVTIVVLPVVALVSNSTRVGRPLPKWLTVVLIIAGIFVGLALANGLLGALIGLAGS